MAVTIRTCNKEIIQGLRLLGLLGKIDKLVSKYPPNLHRDDF